MRKVLLLILLVLAGVDPVAAQVSPTYTFTAGTTISPDEVNANFALLGNALNRTGGTMTGTLTARDITPASTATYDLGVTGTRFRDAWLSRNLAVGGTLDVAGAVTLTAGLTTRDVTPSAHATYDLGVTGTRFRDAWLSRNLAVGGDLTVTGTMAAATMAGTLTARDIAAVANATYDIGATGTRFRDAWLSRNLDVGGTFGATGTATFSGAVTGSGTTSGGSGRYSFAGTHTGGAGANLYGTVFSTSLTPDANDVVGVVLLSGAVSTITEAGSGTHPMLAGVYLIPPTITGGSATVTNTATLYITDAPSTTVTGANYAIRVEAGATSVQSLAFTTTATMGWNTRTPGTTYQAASDGFVYVYSDAVTSGGGLGNVAIYTDGSTPPTTIRARVAVANDYASPSSAVKAGDYYRAVVTTDSGTITSTMYFVPLGTAGGA